MDVSKVNPYIRVAMQGVLPQGCVIKHRIIFDYELIYIEDGEFTFTYNDIAYPCKTGDFIFIRPRVPHSFSEIYVFSRAFKNHFGVAPSNIKNS